MSTSANAVMAARPSSSEDISTKPKPRERPVVRSVTTWADVTVPCLVNNFSKSADA